LEITTEAMLAGRRLLLPTGTSAEMARHAFRSASFLLRMKEKHPHSEFLVETRIYLSFIHPEMFGTFDSAIVDHFGTLHVFDYKYGAGYAVSVERNLQMIFYGIGLAHRYGWNFKRVRLWIIQPRIKGFSWEKNGPSFWELPILELKKYVSEFERAVERVETQPKKYVEGTWCHWCKAKGICPEKTTRRLDKAIDLFKSNPLELPDTVKTVNF
jgi:hypothetical protein